MGNWNSKEIVPANIPKQKVNYNRPKDYYRPQSTICKVKYKEQSGTGSIYGYEFPEGTWRTLFITCNQTVRISDMKEIVNIRLEFKEKTIGNVDMTPDWVKWLWTSPQEQLNVTVIEFSPTALKVLSRMKYARLISATPENNSHVTLYNYNGGHTRGSIIKITGDSIQYTCTIETEIRIGSPLLNDDDNVVGIQAGKWESSNKSAPTIYKAINIQSIVTEYTKYVLKMLNGRTDNEMWLDKINLIPFNEFDHIGSGGYGQVYKIKIKTELADIAVKIVQGGGKMEDYKSPVLALEKEYSMVTSLDNHPRIIQFFGFVRDVSKVRIMLVMEYLEGGSLADKLKDQMPLPKYAVLKYLQQILEGVDFLHQRNIYHSDIKPANILFTKDDDVKLCDFGISVGGDWQTQSSASTSRMKGTFYYMSPERLNDAPRSAANDIWSIGATFVQMISGQKINHVDSVPQFLKNVPQYKIFIKGMPYNNFLQTLSNDDFKRKIISRTLCKESNRANCTELLSNVVRAYPPLTLVRRIPKQTLIRAGENDPDIRGMSYNSAHDELFLADHANKVVRTIRVRNNGGDLREVYRGTLHDKSPNVYSVCHMSYLDTLLVCSRERGPDGRPAFWLVALSRNGSEWREAQRVQTDRWGQISCALSDSRVLIGQRDSTYMELFHVESGPRIARVHRIHVPERYYWFSATCGSDTQFAMSYENKSVRVHRLGDDRLEDLSHIQLNSPSRLLWLADRLIVADYDYENKSDAVIELEVSDKRLERRRQLIATSDYIEVSRLCAVNDGLAILDYNTRDILV